MSDLKAALQDLKEESESGVLAVGERASHRRRTATWLPWVLLAAVLLGSVPLWWYFRNVAEVEAPVSWRGVPLTAYAGREFNPSFSPDGNQVAFRWDGEDGKFHIYIKLIGPGRPLRLTNDVKPDYSPAWSPDGQLIAFYRQASASRLALMLVPALGGPERKVNEFNIQEAVFFAPAWSPDGKWLVVSALMNGTERNALFRCSVDTGEMIRLTEPPAEATHGDDAPAIAPDGAALAFVRLATLNYYHLHVLPLSNDGRPSAPPKRIDTGALAVNNLTWTADNRQILFSTVGERPILFRVPNDGSAKPLPLGLPESTHPAIPTRAKRLAYVERRADTNIWAVDLSSPIPSRGRRENSPDRAAAKSIRRFPRTERDLPSHLPGRETMKSGFPILTGKT